MVKKWPRTSTWLHPCSTMTAGLTWPSTQWEGGSWWGCWEGRRTSGTGMTSSWGWSPRWGLETSTCVDIDIMIRLVQRWCRTRRVSGRGLLWRNQSGWRSPTGWWREGPRPPETEVIILTSGVMSGLRVWPRWTEDIATDTDTGDTEQRVTVRASWAHVSCPHDHHCSPRGRDVPGVPGLRVSVRHQPEERQRGQGQRQLLPADRQHRQGQAPGGGVLGFNKNFVHNSMEFVLNRICYTTSRSIYSWLVLKVKLYSIKLLS